MAFTASLTPWLVVIAATMMELTLAAPIDRCVGAVTCAVSERTAEGQELVILASDMS